MTSYPVGREPIQIVEILQPLCTNEFGVAPCTATGTADTKCYNTRATCQDTANFALGTPLSLFFTKAQFLPTLQANQTVPVENPTDWILYDGTWSDAGIWYDAAFWRDDDQSYPQPVFDPVNSTMPPYIFPDLVSVSTSPTRVNLAVASSDAKGLGNRALCTIKFKDFQHTDRLVDPYVDGRSWDPLSADRGSFWTRWLVRNKYRTNMQVKVYEGYAGQNLSDMSVRLYFVDGISNVDSSGNITMRCKDVLARIESRQAQAPVASPGVLFDDITDAATSIEVAGALLSEYEASGTLRIGDEVMTYTSVATSTNGITFSGVTRGTDSTTAEEHSFDAGVQQCIRYTETGLSDLLIDLLQTRGGIPAVYMADFAPGQPSAEEISSYMSLFVADRVLTEPYSISELISDLAEQFQFYIWWEETEQRIKFKPIRGYSEAPDTLTDSVNILSNSFSLTEKPRERFSQVWFFYSQKDPTQGDDDLNNYNSQYVIANLESETDELYGSASIRRILGTWTGKSIIAASSSTRFLNKYVDVPSEASFRVDIKDGDYQIGDTFFVSHFMDVTQYGERRLRPWTVVSREEKVANEVVEYVCEDTTLYGRVYFIMAPGSGNYDPSDVPFDSAYIGNAAGVLSDGTAAANIG